MTDNWRPLFSIADIIGDDWPERAREAAAALAPRESESTGPMLLTDILAAFEAGAADRLASADTCEALAAMEGRPWAEWKGGKPLSPNQLARLLKPFGVIPDNVRIGGRVVKGYHRHQFKELWERYLAGDGVFKPLQRYKADEMGTSNGFRTATPEPDVAVQKSEKPPSNGHCSVVAVQNGDGRPREDNPPDDFPDMPEFLRREQPEPCIRCDHCGAPGTPASALTPYDWNGREVLLHGPCEGPWFDGASQAAE